MAGIVYILCVLTSLACALLLLRGYGQSRVRLLLWSGLCFVGLAFHNALLYTDVYIFPQRDLSTWRNIPALIGVAILLYGLIWEENND